MKLVITESKMSSIIHRILNMEFGGFDDIYYDWGNYNCGMGECCDPYAIVFILPQNEYNDYLFKLVDGKFYDDDGDYPKKLSEDLPEPCYESPDVRDPRFDTYIGYSELMENIEGYIGAFDKWEEELLHFLNRKFNSDAKRIIFI